MTTFSAVPLDLSALTFFKTAAGLTEIQTRAMGFPAMIRRVLVLVDGKRSGKELAAFVGGEEKIAEALCQLVAHGCIDAQEASRTATATAPVTALKPATAISAPLDDVATELARLPHAALRSAKEVEMTRNFMVNTTTNTLFGQNQRLSLLKAIMACQGAEDLRQVYPEWVNNMATTGTSAKRLPELREKLLRVL